MTMWEPGDSHIDSAQQPGGHEGGQWMTGPPLPPSAVGIATEMSTIVARRASAHCIDVSLFVNFLTSFCDEEARFGEPANGPVTAGKRIANDARLGRG